MAFNPELALRVVVAAECLSSELRELILLQELVALATITANSTRHLPNRRKRTPARFRS